MFYENNSKAVSSNKMFLLEVIVSIFFFVVFATVTTRVFFIAHNNNQKSIVTNKAMLLCQDVAESYIAEQGDVQKVAPYFKLEDGKYVLRFTKDWEIADQDGFRYVVVFESEDKKTESGIIKNGLVQVFDKLSKDDDALYSLDFNTYVPNLSY